MILAAVYLLGMGVGSWLTIEVLKWLKQAKTPFVATMPSPPPITYVKATDLKEYFPCSH